MYGGEPFVCTKIYFKPTLDLRYLALLSMIAFFHYRALRNRELFLHRVPLSKLFSK